MLSIHRFQKPVFSLSVLFGFMTFVEPAIAEIVTSPEGLEISAPASVLEGQLESDLFAVFAEKDGVNLSAGGVDVNLIGDAIISYPLASFSFASEPITVNSYMVHFDPGTPFTGGQKTVAGSVTFDDDILAVIVGDSLLDLSDPIFGAGGTLYPTGQSGRGLENNGSKDDDWLSVAGKVLTITLLLETGDSEQDIDQIRILTNSYQIGQQIEEQQIEEQEIPEPATLTIVGLGLIGFGIVRRKRSSKTKYA